MEIRWQLPSGADQDNVKELWAEAMAERLGFEGVIAYWGNREGGRFILLGTAR